MSLRSDLQHRRAARAGDSTAAAPINEWFLDSPAGIPDGAGQFAVPAAAAADARRAARRRSLAARDSAETSTACWSTRLTPNVANAIIFSVQPGQPQPPPPLYCQVPVEVAASAPAARQQLFIAPPPVPADAVQAENYARANGFAFLPTIACTPELLTASGGAVVITAFISQPSPGQIVSAGFPIVGTVQFSPQQAQYWKLELHGGQFGDNWVTMNDVQYNNVVNGQLASDPRLAARQLRHAVGRRRQRRQLRPDALQRAVHGAVSGPHARACLLSGRDKSLPSVFDNRWRRGPVRGARSCRRRLPRPPEQAYNIHE